MRWRRRWLASRCCSRSVAPRSASSTLSDLGFLPSRLYGIVTNQTLIAVPLFVLMGVTLERTRIAATLLESLSVLMGRLRGEDSAWR